MSKFRILYVSSEINPFLETTNVAKFVRKLPEVMQERGFEIRILVPKFGCINERKNRLHEVVRLSGINIAVGEEEKPLIIKVASIPTAKLQVYFIDNDDYFGRKSALYDKNEFHKDNDERAIFFSKGVLETVKKLGWAPDIVHCNDWMTSLIPFYLKTHYKKDPIYKDVKTVFSVFDSYFPEKFDKSTIVEKARMSDIDEKYLDKLRTADYEGFIRMGMEYADVVMKAEEKYHELHQPLFGESPSERLLEYVNPDDNIEHYNTFYNELVEVNELVEN